MPGKKGQKWSTGPVGHKWLVSWVVLNTNLMEAKLAACEKLLEIEKKHRRRHEFLTRIHSRINRLRRVEERKKIAKIAG